MGVRDEELKRLIKYANAMGANVSIKKRPLHSRARAEWSTSGDQITLYPKDGESKVQLLLSFIHELGHHKSFIHDDNKVHPKGLVKALELDEVNAPLSKYQKHLILQSELKGMKWWDSIYLETGMTFPIYKLYMEREYDTWWYNFWFQVGRDPIKRERRAKLKQLKEVFNAKIER